MTRQDSILGAQLDLVYALADDELMIGSQDVKWTGVAPLLEEDVALSSIAQDEIGHALAFYGLAASAAKRRVDDVVYRRSGLEFRHARVLEIETQDFAFTMARRFLYEAADYLRLASLRQSGWAELAALAEGLQRDEELHLDHAHLWVKRLGSAEPGRARLVEALETLLPASSTILAPLARESILLETGVLRRSWSELQARWRDEVSGVLASLDLAELIPAVMSPSDRESPTTEGFASFHRDLFAVRNVAPEASW